MAGPDLLTYADVAAELTDALGREIEYRRITPGEHRESMIAAGVPEPVAISNAQVFDLIAAGGAEWLSDDVGKEEQSSQGTVVVVGGTAVPIVTVSVTESTISP
ncbi:hypothetical protein [Nocardia brasiliensis]